MNDPQPLRLSNIDILRGLAAIMVTFFHLVGNTTVRLPYLSAFTKYGFLGVEIFFIISGFILPYSMVKSGYNIKNFFKFIISRIIRIYPAFIISITIGLIVAIITHRNTFGVKDILLNFLLIKDTISPAFWTLAIEFQFYILIGLIPYLFAANKAAPFILVSSAILITFILPYPIFHWLPFFAIGILTFNRHRSALSLKLYVPLLIALLLWIGYRHGAFFSGISIITVLILQLNIKESTLLVKVFTWLGAISYSLYLVHWELGRAAVSAARRLPVFGAYDLFRLAIGLGFSVLTAWLLYKLIEKPALILSKRYKNKTNATDSDQSVQGLPSA